VAAGLAQAAGDAPDKAGVALATTGESSFTSAAGGLQQRVRPPAFLATDRFLAGSAVSGRVCQAR
jgi:hypothetical protein